jgi:hypothetical protein
MLFAWRYEMSIDTKLESEIVKILDEFVENELDKIVIEEIEYELDYWNDN